MINIEDKSQCTGCGACQQICGRNAITMRAENDGHIYPYIDLQLCVNCGLCVNVCPMLHKDDIPNDEDISSLPVYAVYNNDEDVRSKSTSGGIFTLLAKRIIESEGVVYAARFDERFHIKHDSFTSIDQIDQYRGSKYAQSELADTFKKIKQDLRFKPVLFVGTPCQVAGLKSYLRKDYNNLYTCDFVCMGISSPIIWESYLDEFWNRDTIKKIFFKDKRNGWHNWRFLITDEYGEHLIKGEEDPFFFSYLHHISSRPSCVNCPYRTCRRISDFTIADCWGIERAHPEFDDDKGCSTLILQSKKANLLFDEIKSELSFLEYDMDCVMTYNPYIVNRIVPSRLRRKFYVLYKNKGSKSAFNYIIKCKSSYFHKIVTMLFH